MRAILHLSLWSLGCVYLLLSGVNVRAQASGTAIDQILPAISTPSLANLRAAEKAFQTQDPVATEVLSKYAMALALVANNQHPPAHKLVESIPLEARKAGPLRRLHIWLTIKMRSDELAHAELQAIIDELRTRSSTAPTPKDLDDLQFIGKVVVYLEQIAEREEPLTPQQAKGWRLALEGLPAPWNAELATIQTDLTSSHNKRKQELEDAFIPWREKTEKELAVAQQEAARIKAQDTAARDQLKTATNAQQAFVAQAQPQLVRMDASVRQLSAQRRLLRRPIEPSEPDDDKDGKGKGGGKSRSEYNREVKEYDKKLEAYERNLKVIDDELARINAQALVFKQQGDAHQGDVDKSKAEVAKIVTPLRLAEKNAGACSNCWPIARVGIRLAASPHCAHSMHTWKLIFRVKLRGFNRRD